MANHLIIRGKSERSQNLQHPHPSTIFGGSHFCCHGEILVEIALVFPGGFGPQQGLSTPRRGSWSRPAAAPWVPAQDSCAACPPRIHRKMDSFIRGYEGYGRSDRTHRIHLEIPDSTDSSGIFRWRFQLFGTESEGSGCWWRATAVQISSVGK